MKKIIPADKLEEFIINSGYYANKKKPQKIIQKEKVRSPMIRKIAEEIRNGKR